MPNKIAISLIACIPLAGCSPQVWEVDQNMRHKLFKECLQISPDGPQSSKYGYVDDIIQECEDAAYEQSRFCIKKCPAGVQTQPFIKPNQAQN